jgi:2-dehydropantoate 2-reductase
VRIAVIGVGAVGGYFGGRLVAAGEDVIFFARGETLSTLRTDGLQIASPLGDLTLRSIRASHRAALTGHVDAVIFAVKTWQLAKAAETARPLVGPETVVVPLQNGVESEDELARIFGRDKVLGAICRILASVESPGRIRHLGIDPFVAVGELEPGISRRAAGLVDAFTRAGVTAVQSENIHAAIWEKFLFVSPTAGVCAATRSPVGVVRSIPETRRLLTEAMTEVHRLAIARGVPLAEDTVERTLAFFDTLPASATSSMQRDIMDGRPSELEAHVGATVRLGHEAGIAIPANEFLYASLLPQELAARDGRKSR